MVKYNCKSDSFLDFYSTYSIQWLNKTGFDSCSAPCEPFPLSLSFGVCVLNAGNAHHTGSAFNIHKFSSSTQCSLSRIVRSLLKWFACVLEWVSESVSIYMLCRGILVSSSFRICEPMYRLRFQRSSINFVLIYISFQMQFKANVWPGGEKGTRHNVWNKMLYAKRERRKKFDTMVPLQEVSGEIERE